MEGLQGGKPSALCALIGKLHDKNNIVIGHLNRLSGLSGDRNVHLFAEENEGNRDLGLKIFLAYVTVMRIAQGGDKFRSGVK